MSSAEAGSLEEARVAGAVTYFRSLPDAPSVTVDADPEIVGSSAELGAAGMRNWSGDLMRLVHKRFQT